MEKISPQPDFLNKDSVFLYKGKATMTLNGRQTTEIHGYLFNDFLVVGKKNVVAIVKNLTKPPLKLLHIWPIRELSIKKGTKKRTFLLFFFPFHSSCCLRFF